MFVESIQRIHPGITEQNASQLREFLVTARQRQQSDSQTLSLSFQDLKQEVLDEGYDWDDLITILVVLLSTGLQEEQHEQFVAELHDLYTNLFVFFYWKPPPLEMQNLTPRVTHYMMKN